MKKQKKEKKQKTKKVSKFSIFLIIVDILAIGCFFLAYGPISYFRDLLVTTAMTTMSHQYFAYVLYSEEEVDKILDNNKIIEPDQPTDTSLINIKPITILTGKNAKFINAFKKNFVINFTHSTISREFKS